MKGGGSLFILGLFAIIIAVCVLVFTYTELIPAEYIYEYDYKNWLSNYLITSIVLLLIVASIITGMISYKKSREQKRIREIYTSSRPPPPPNVRPGTWRHH